MGTHGEFLYARPSYWISMRPGRFVGPAVQTGNQKLGINISSWLGTGDTQFIGIKRAPWMFLYDLSRTKAGESMLSSSGLWCPELSSDQLWQTIKWNW